MGTFGRFSYWHNFSLPPIPMPFAIYFRLKKMFQQIILVHSSLHQCSCKVKFLYGGMSPLRENIQGLQKSPLGLLGQPWLAWARVDGAQAGAQTSFSPLTFQRSPISATLMRLLLTFTCAVTQNLLQNAVCFSRGASPELFIGFSEGSRKMWQSYLGNPYSYKKLKEEL